MKRFASRLALVSGAALSLLTLTSVSAVFAQTTIISQNWEDPASVPSGAYSGADVTAVTFTNVAGQGVGGSRVEQLDYTFFSGPNGYGLVGLQVNTTANANTDANLGHILISFDARSPDLVGSATLSSYIQSWHGVYAGAVSGTSFYDVNLTSAYHHYSFHASDMFAVGAFDPTLQTVQLSFQQGSWQFGGSPLGNHTLQIDNISVTAISAAAVPEPGAYAFGILAVGSVAGLMVRKRKA